MARKYTYNRTAKTVAGFSKMAATKRGKPREGLLVAASENHINSKRFLLVSPNKKIYEVINLNHFVRTHPELFAPEDIEPRNTEYKTKARGGLASLFYKNGARSWKGWLGPRDPEYVQIIQALRKYPL